jgi:hypothetical protein
MARSEPRAAASLSQLAGLIDWAAIDRDLVGLLNRPGFAGGPNS